MPRLGALVWLLGIAVGCGAAAGNLDAGATTGGAGAGGAGGSGAPGTMCPSVGATGGIGADGLPFCRVTARPLDPLNADGAVDAHTNTVPNTANDENNCNGLETADAGATAAALDCLSGPWCIPEPFAVGDGGVALDSGAGERPAGGTLVDGDYQLVRYRSNVANGHASKRAIGLYDGATYVEWASEQQGASALGGDQLLRLNTTMRAAGSGWTVVTVNCGSLDTPRYDYTASGTELDLYDTDASGVLRNVYSYQRTCSR